jgi:hypothetical protein
MSSLKTWNPLVSVLNQRLARSQLAFSAVSSLIKHSLRFPYRYMFIHNLKFNFLAAIYAANAKPYYVESYESYE